MFSSIIKKEKNCVQIEFQRKVRKVVVCVLGNQEVSVKGRNLDTMWYEDIHWINDIHPEDLSSMIGDDFFNIDIPKLPLDTFVCESIVMEAGDPTPSPSKNFLIFFPGDTQLSLEVTWDGDQQKKLIYCTYYTFGDKVKEIINV